MLDQSDPNIKCLAPLNPSGLSSRALDEDWGLLCWDDASVAKLCKAHNEAARLHWAR